MPVFFVNDSTCISKPPEGIKSIGTAAINIPSGHVDIRVIPWTASLSTTSTTASPTRTTTSYWQSLPSLTYPSLSHQSQPSRLVPCQTYYPHDQNNISFDHALQAHPQHQPPSTCLITLLHLGILWQIHNCQLAPSPSTPSSMTKTLHHRLSTVTFSLKTSDMSWLKEKGERKAEVDKWR